MKPRAARSNRRAPATVRGLTPATQLARRHQAEERARVYRRRRAVTLLTLAVLAGAVFVSCSVASGSSGKGPTKTTGPATVPTSTMPASFNVGLHTFDWMETGQGVDHVGPEGQLLPGRALTTEVRYPTLAGTASTESKDAVPAHVGGPYPVIVFAHGFETVPADYAQLLDGWVRAGFVVVSPLFPDESSPAVAAAGGDTDTSIATELESDQFLEPGDIAFVLQRLATVTSQPSGAKLKGTLDLSDVALAGQSDGADVVAALTYASALAGIDGSLASAPKAVAILSGSAWGALGSRPIGVFASSPTSPALLQIQSDADGCVAPTAAVDLFSQLQAGSEPKWFVTLFGADHLAPYTGGNRWASVVTQVTTTFFELELHWRAKTLSPSSVGVAGDVSGIAQTTTSVNENTMPQVAANGGCGIPS